jgi:hypothetical protein
MSLSLRAFTDGAVRHMVQENRRMGGLVGPVLLLGPWASFFATLSNPRNDLHLEPVAWMVALAGVSFLMHTRRSRLLLLPLAIWVGCMLWPVGPSYGGWVNWLLSRSAFAVILLILLAPVVAASLRAESSRPGSIVRASQARSPWCAAFVVAGVLGDWIGGFWINTEAGSSPSPLRNEVALPSWGFFALAVAAAFLAVDVAAFIRVRRLLARMSGEGSAPSIGGARIIDLGIGDEQRVFPFAEPAGAHASNEGAAYRETGSITVFGSPSEAARELRRSVGIDAAAVVVTVGFWLWAYGFAEHLWPGTLS